MVVVCVCVCSLEWGRGAGIVRAYFVRECWRVAGGLDGEGGWLDASLSILLTESLMSLMLGVGKEWGLMYYWT